ncbi:monocarboxylate transporter 9-like isoform X2 [Penaeus chinensis]|uniref:monocarboxylate transporter 9-like isoform X2 n=1 Tax=Penaeus chinensis TaxID=139456 RepID=UPI001FB7883E|nr:monocarboxylate transporter 9-like isoform X2 [Penaeus chinensis]
MENVKAEEQATTRRRRLDSGLSPQLEPSEKEARAPDGGWAWVILVGASLILVLVDTIGQCFGVIFSTFLLDLGTDLTTSTWIFNIASFLWSITGPFLGPLEEEFGWRSVALGASFVLAAGTVMSAFVTSAAMLFFTYSTLVGLGCGVLYNISCMIVPFYFNKRRGLANGVLMAWEGGGQFLGPPLINFLQAQYGFRGATLVLGAIVFNCAVGAAVFHPVEWHLKPLEKSEGVRPESSQGKVPDAPTLSNEGSDSQASAENVLSKQSEEGKPKSPRSPDTLRQPNQSQVPQVHRLPDGIPEQQKSPHPAAKENTKKQEDSTIVRLIKSTLADLCILKHARAVVIALSITLTLNANENFLNVLPFAMQEAGHSLHDVATGVSVSALCGMLIRVVVSPLTDMPKFNMRVVFMFGSLVVALSMIGGEWGTLYQKVLPREERNHLTEQYFLSDFASLTKDAHFSFS